MPLYIVRQDITKMPCDVIVNTTNRHVSCDYGVAGAILDAAGEELCEYLPSFIEVGEVYATPAFNLPSKAIIHVVGPVWRGGGYLEKELLAVSYKNVLEKAAELNASSVAIPLISAGSRKFPKEYVLNIAVNTIASFLMDNEMEVYLVVYDKDSYSIGKELFGDIAEFINDNYVEEDVRTWRTPGQRYRRLRLEPFISEQAPNRNGADGVIFPFIGDEHSKTEDKVPIERKQAQPAPPVDDEDRSLGDSMDISIPSLAKLDISDHISEIEKILRQADASFADTLFKLIDARGMTDVECYKKANVSRQTWHKILSDEGYKPSKTTVIAFAIALKLDLNETKHLLETVGFALSKSNKFDIIIEYCIMHRIYDVLEINNVLFKYDQTLLGV